MYRKAKSSDCESVYRLICDLEQQALSFTAFAAIFQKQIENALFHCLICECEEQVIGVLNLRLEEQLHHAACVAEIMELVVDRQYRNRGIGRELLTQACALAKQLGCVQIEVACNQLRTDTHRFYAREDMNNFHFKFSKSLRSEDIPENKIGR